MPADLMDRERPVSLDLTVPGGELVRCPRRALTPAAVAFNWRPVSSPSSPTPVEGIRVKAA